jgi:hypothetical protein
MSARRLTLLFAVALACAICAGTAAAAAGGDAIPGATYGGTAADGAQVTLTISSDGTLVTAYRITGASGGSCQFYGEGDSGVWQGAPIVNNTFVYHLGDALSLRGTFPNAQSASGTFQFQQAASGHAAACNSGIISWTLTTTAHPGSGGTGGHEPAFWTRISFRRASTKMLRGQIKSPGGACRAGRTVYLWRGGRRIASTKSKAGGKFSFAVTTRVRGRQVRASAAARSVQAGACAAGSSVFIKG